MRQQKRIMGKTFARRHREREGWGGKREGERKRKRERGTERKRERKRERREKERGGGEQWVTKCA